MKVKVFQIIFIFLLSLFVFGCGEKTPDGGEEPNKVLDGIEDSLDIYVEEVYIYDIDAEIVFSTEETDIISVNSETKEVTGITEGSATLKITLKDNEKVYRYVIVSVSLKPHTHEYEKVVTNPTCTSEGYTTYTCSCGDTYTDNFVEKVEHSYEANVIEKTCTKSGYTEYVCNCGDSYKTDYVYATGHEYGYWKTVKEPTESEKGQREKTCAACGNVVSEEMPLLSNASSFSITFDLNGGMLGSGYKTLEEVCDDFLADFNKYGNTNATKANFLNDSTNSIKPALAQYDMLVKWKWLFTYMYNDLKNYNTANGNMGVSYVSECLAVLPQLINCDTSVSNLPGDQKGSSFRTLVRSYLHGMMNECKGDQKNNPTFAKYAPDFSDPAAQQALLDNQFELTKTLNKGTVLEVPTKEGHTFIGWMDAKENFIIKAVQGGKLTAIWKENVVVTDIRINNSVEEILLYDTLKLNCTVLPFDASVKDLKFESSNKNIASVDKDGVITALKCGEVTIRVISQSESKKVREMKIKVVTPAHFEISYETNSYVIEGEEILLNAIYHKSDEVWQLEWKSLDDTIATVNSDGLVSGLKAGTATIRVSVVGLDNVYQDFIVTVVSKEISDALQVVLNAHESNVFVEYNLPIGAGTPVYYADVFGSVNKLLFNNPLEINTRYNAATNNKYGAELKNRLLESVEFITVHYTGNMNPGADANMHGSYFAQPLSSVSTSIHYSTGNDGVYKGMDEIYRAAHAGDDGSLETVKKFEWRDTPVEVLESDPEFAVVTITANATFAINGRDTGIKVPEETKYGRGFVTDNKWLNDMGIAVNIKDGKYQLGTAWWCYTQIGEGRICSNGGNRNSIGIESAVNKGSDLWFTWQKTAQLVADIMYRHNLDITRVKGHHFFSAKDCPQPMLENELRVWWEFIDLCKAEYELRSLTSNPTITYSSSSEYLGNYGRVTKQENTSTLVTYTVSVTVNGKTEKVELASIIPGVYLK